MKITIPGTVRWAGLAAMAAGLSYALVGVLHPAKEPSTVTSTAGIAAPILAMATSFFGLFGLTGRYARHAEKFGWLGLAGYPLLSLRLALILGFSFAEVLVLPALLFGVATFHARILLRWAGLLLAAGTVMGPLAAFVPLDWQPKAAIPFGVALLWLGYSLWSERGARTPAIAPSAVTA
jgi:hypothetical protein